MVQSAPGPIIWHLMKYYAHYGHKDFILCLGYRADVIKKYFLNYDECVSNDFVSPGAPRASRCSATSRTGRSPSSTLVSTRISASGLRPSEHLDGEDVFLANYSDGLHRPAAADD